MAYSIPSSKKDKKYIVVETQYGVWTCTCPHWLFRLSKVGTACKHIVWAQQIKPILDDPRHWERDWSEDVPRYRY